MRRTHTSVLLDIILRLRHPLSRMNPFGRRREPRSNASRGKTFARGLLPEGRSQIMFCAAHTEAIAGAARSVKAHARPLQSHTSTRRMSERVDAGRSLLGRASRKPSQRFPCVRLVRMRPAGHELRGRGALQLDRSGGTWSGMSSMKQEWQKVAALLFYRLRC